jgi:hydrogenase maturation protein HypF
VQHHHAHLAALFTEHGLLGSAPAIIADGTGYGEDGAIWGGELLYGDERSYERIAHLRQIMLPGGDAAVRDPWRIALALLHAAAPEEMPHYAWMLLSGELSARVQHELPFRLGAESAPTWQPPEAGEVELVQHMLAQGVGVAASTALGRLFDGIAALLGITLHTFYEGQAPMELEALAGCPASDAPEVSWAETQAIGVIDWAPLVRKYLLHASTIAERAQHFHGWVAKSFLSAVVADAKCKQSRILLASGGCMQNSLLKRLLSTECERHGLQLLTHREIPAGDGGLALGVLRVAQARLMLGLEGQSS